MSYPGPKEPDDILLALYFDPAPLLALVAPIAGELPVEDCDGWSPSGFITADRIAQVLGISQRTVHRWRYDGTQLSWVDADRFATRLGLHPALIWTDWSADLSLGEHDLARATRRRVGHDRSQDLEVATV